MRDIKRLHVEEMTASDWEAVQSIYEQGIHTGHATFETRVPSWQEWNQSHLTCCRLVGRLELRIVGWAALSPVSRRSAYSGVAEVSVYVAAEERGRSIGYALLSALVHASEHASIWTLQASIFPENLASIALHERCGFRVVGHRQKIGQLRGVWRDVALMERRSRVVGA